MEYPIPSNNGFTNDVNGNSENLENSFHLISGTPAYHPDQSALNQINNNNNNPLSKTIMLDGDFEFLRYLGLDELKSRMANLDLEMEEEIEELRRRYAAKRQPILDAMDSKKKRQQNF